MTDVLLSHAAAGAVDPPRQHASHRRLLERDVVPVGRAPIDAVIVPATRAAHRLAPAVRLASDLGCPVVALCSYAADATAINEAVWSLAATVIAVDVPNRTALPRFRTTELLAHSLFARTSDTSRKRNLGLALARMTGWQRVLFLDDDITHIRAEALEEAATLLGGYGAVGLENEGFPDNSVVCHANRDTGGAQGTFVGAGAMLFPGSRVTSFFPEIYNEDWFFLLDGDGDGLVKVAVHGTFAQAPFDPYANPRRAGSEEFGDCMAEGIFSLLDHGHGISDADLAFWSEFLAHRMMLVDTIIHRARTAKLSNPRREQIIAALRAARSHLQRITPVLCVDYLDAWRRDQKLWQRFIERLPVDTAPEQALGILGLKA